MRLSVIIPYCNEYPQNAFTVQTVWNELKTLEALGHSFEIITVDNWCDQAAAQVKHVRECDCKDLLLEFVDGIGSQIEGTLTLHPELKKPYREYLAKLRDTATKKVQITRTEDKGGRYFSGLASGHSWWRNVRYVEKLSHWQAKNAGVATSTGDVLLFLDAHVVPSKNSIVDAFTYYISHIDELDGTLHLPLTYLLERSGKLTYKFVGDPDNGYYHYSFTRFQPAEQPYMVDCMSTCGMLMSRKLYNLLGGWPKELGIYGGGEHFINFTLAVLGKHVWIYPGEPLYHYAEKRGYNYLYDDMVRNRILATYMFGGEATAKLYINHLINTGKGKATAVEPMLSDIIDKCAAQRKHILHNQKYDIKDWYYNRRPSVVSGSKE